MYDLASGLRLKVPHMGWNQVRQTRVHPLWAHIAQEERFYFVHSYYADSTDAGDVLGTTDYGLCFTAAAGRDNIFAVQFHPEKSQKAGLQLLHNFVHWDGTV
jgi:glutamine amidotransferase